MWYTKIKTSLYFLTSTLLLWPWEISWDQYKTTATADFFLPLTGGQEGTCAQVVAWAPCSCLPAHVHRARIFTNVLFLSSKMGMKITIFSYFDEILSNKLWHKYFEKYAVFTRNFFCKSKMIETGKAGYSYLFNSCFYELFSFS